MSLTTDIHMLVRSSRLWEHRSIGSCWKSIKISQLSRTVFFQLIHQIVIIAISKWWLYSYSQNFFSWQSFEKFKLLTSKTSSQGIHYFFTQLRHDDGAISNIFCIAMYHAKFNHSSCTLDSVSPDSGNTNISNKLLSTMWIDKGFVTNTMCISSMKLSKFQSIVMRDDDSQKCLRKSNVPIYFSVYLNSFDTIEKFFTILFHHNFFTFTCKCQIMSFDSTQTKISSHFFQKQGNKKLPPSMKRE